jgi:hypothetical protein
MSFQSNSTGWASDYEAAKTLSSEILALCNERHTGDKAEQSRRNVALRRRLGTLGTQLDSLLANLEEPGLSEAAKNRRRDQIYELSTRRESLAQLIKTSTSKSTQERCGNIFT